jgi:uncharacterized protein (DUF362 family)
MRRWVIGSTLLSGLFALLWLVLRSGTKPSRLAYPCQQAAFATAAASFGVPLVAGLLALRTRLIGGLATTRGKVATGSCLALAFVVLAFATSQPGRLTDPLAPPADYHPDVFVVNNARGIEPGRYAGVDDLTTLMGVSGFKWYASADTTVTSGPDGMIDAGDVVLIKVNAQWAERGGTNTDVIRGIIRRVVEHPDGFVGEVVVADNGQNSGNLNRIESNAEEHTQSVQDVVNDFADEGWTVSTFLWDTIRTLGVDEYADADMSSGYVVSADYDPETDVKISYPKFQTAPGTLISYKYGVWSPASQTYDPDRLVVINVPVLKTHSIYGITAAVKNHMGLITTAMSTDCHHGVARGGLGSVLAEVRLPDLTILDAIYVLARPGYGPAAYYEHVNRRDQLLASTDPIALDMWAVKNVIIPQIIDNGYDYASYHNTQDPDNLDSTFRLYLDRSMNELLLAGIDTTNDLDAINLHAWYGDVDRDGDVDTLDYADLAWCLTGPDDLTDPTCTASDHQQDNHVDLADAAAFQQMFTGSFD